MSNRSAVVALLALCMLTPAKAAVQRASARAAAPDFSLTDSHGSTVRLSDFKGRVVLLNFWATWCYDCRQELPWYGEFQATYAQQGLTAVGVAMDVPGWKVVKPYLMKRPIDYPVVLGTAEVAKAFGLGRGLPVTLLIDRNGRIADAHQGLINKRAVEHEIKHLLREKAVEPIRAGKATSP